MDNTGIASSGDAVAEDLKNRLETLKKYALEEVKKCDELIKEKDKELASFLSTSRKVDAFPKKLSHRDEWIPICDVAFIKGNYTDTNRFQVMLGQEYFVEKSASETVQFLSRRMQETKAVRDAFDKQRELARSRLEFADQLFSQQGEMVEIQEEYSPEKMKKKSSVKVETREEVDVMNLLEKLEQQEEKNAEIGQLEEVEEARRYAQMAAGRFIQEMDDSVDSLPVKPKGVSQEDFDKFLQQVSELDVSTEDDEEGEDDYDDDTEDYAADVSENVETMTENDEETTIKSTSHTFKVHKVIQKRNEELDSDDSLSAHETELETPSKPAKTHKNSRKRTVRFAEVLAAGPSVSPPVVHEPRPILKNKDQEIPIDKAALKAMDEDDIKKKEILPPTDAFNGVFIERNVDLSEQPSTSETVQKPPEKPVSRFKARRMGS